MGEGAIGYARVSDPRQVTQGQSLETQRQAITEYCAREGLELLEVFVEEGRSARTAGRAEFQRALQCCRERAGEVRHLVVYQLSRWSRSTHDHAVLAYELEQLGIRLRSVTESFDQTPSGRLVRDLLAVVAEYDNSQRGARVLHGMKSAVKRGRWVWQPPLGYLSGSTVEAAESLVPDPARAPILRAGLERLACGAYSGAEVLRRMTREGLTTRSGNPVRKTDWSRMIRNPAYAGRLRVDGWGVDQLGDWEPLIDEVTWARLQRTLAGMGRGRDKSRVQDHPDFPLRRVVRCTCGLPLTGGWARSRTGRLYGYYWCRLSRCHNRIPRERLHELWQDLLDELRAPEPLWRLVELVIRDAWEEQAREAEGQRAELGASVALLERRLAALLDLYLDGQVARALYDKKHAALLAEAARLRGDLADLSVDADLEEVLAVARRLLAEPGEAWEAGDPEQRLALQQVLLGVESGVELSGGAISTPQSPLFSVVRALKCRNAEKVCPAGPWFEPGYLIAALRPLVELSWLSSPAP